MKTVIKENTWLKSSFMDFGWGNGYALIPVGHPAHGLDYGDIQVNVHYGLTFATSVDEEMIAHWPELSDDYLGFWIVGFDTAHYGDDRHKWPKEAVQAEADRLAEQLENYSGVGEKLL